MKLYQVQLKSRDNHKYYYKCEAECLAEAEIKALEHLIDIGYSIYDYRCSWSREITPEELSKQSLIQFEVSPFG